MQTYVKCKKCGTLINVDTGYNYIPCNCGAIAVDGGPQYCRVIGDRENWESVKRDDENT